MGSEEVHWDEILRGIYVALAPSAGRLHWRKPAIGTPEVLGYLAIVYEFDDGIYYDPFYHWTDLAMRELCFESYDFAPYLHVATVADLVGKSFDFESLTWTGIFSNSLDPVVRTVQFGAYHNGKIACALTFSLTNTESYGMMSGTLEEHLRSSKTIDMELICLELD